MRALHACFLPRTRSQHFRRLFLALLYTSPGFFNAFQSGATFHNRRFEILRRRFPLASCPLLTGFLTSGFASRIFCFFCSNIASLFNIAAGETIAAFINRCVRGCGPVFRRRPFFSLLGSMADSQDSQIGPLFKAGMSVRTGGKIYHD